MSSDKGNDERQQADTYRTKSKAGDVAKIPELMPVITDKSFQNAMSLKVSQNWYLQPLELSNDLEIVHDQIFFKGLPATLATLKPICRNKNLGDFNLSLLRMIYGIILKRFEETYRIGCQEKIISFYYPDLARMMGKTQKTSSEDRKALLDNLGVLHNIAGVTEAGSVLPVLVFLGYHKDTDTFEICSPYLNKVIEDLYLKSIRRGRTGKELLKSSGQPLTRPVHSYAIKSSIAKERNHRAVEIVVIIVTVIEQAGRNTPHISARTIVGRNPQLLESINATSATCDKNKKLGRAFTKAFELLRRCTRLEKMYKNIRLPDPKAKDFREKYIPTMERLNLVYEFPHNGKVQDRRGKNVL